VEGASVHPRVRGEHLNSHKAGLWDDGSSPRIRGNTDGAGMDIGSSPRMRGTRVAARPYLRANRFIPAHAGNTRSVR